MLNRRLSPVSVAAILVATSLATLAMWWRQGDGFGGHQGFPFAWHWWGDVYTESGVVAGYFWGGLVADLAIWGALIVAFGLYVERTRNRQLKQRESKNAA